MADPERVTELDDELAAVTRTVLTGTVGASGTMGPQRRESA